MTSKRTLTFCLLAMISGCGEPEPELVPVAGTVTVDGQPLSKGTVAFVPDAARGNQSLDTPQGKIAPDGTYQLKTLDKLGAAPGRYKVVVSATANEPPPADSYAVKDWRPEWLVNIKYTQAQTTDLSREVVATPPPGAYDLRLTK
jgi:hypothetical protein